MIDWEWEPPGLPASIPAVTPRDRALLVLPDGREITVRKPVGFVNHPAVQDAYRKVPR